MLFSRVRVVTESSTTRSRFLGEAGAGAEAAETAKRSALLVASGERRLALLVDGLIAEQEVVVKGLGPRLRRVRSTSGATILPSGRIALVVNVAGLVRAGLVRGASAAPPKLSTSTSISSSSSSSSSSSGPPRKRLLVVDDSVTTRTLEKSILEAAGYEVATAVDGEAGWRVLQEQGADLVIADVEMPGMDGFALTEAVRASPRFAALPVVLFSSRASEHDRARGLEVGADAYIVKGTFDQKDLLETVAQLL